MLSYPYLPAGSGGLKIATWADGTDEEISAIIAAADAGEIELADYWSVGDERTINLSAMTASGTNDYGSWSVGETHAAQTVTMVIMNQGYNVVGCNNSHVHFVVGLKHSLNEKGYMNSTNTNAGGWKNCARRGWCNSIFRASIPDTIRSIFKQFNTKTANGGSNTNYSAIDTTQDYFALFAGKEIFNEEQSGPAGSFYPAYSGGYSIKDEADNLSQITYYSTSSNRIKQVNGANDRWWERSPAYSYATHFCYVYGDGSAGGTDAGNTIGLAPFGCI